MTWNSSYLLGNDSISGWGEKYFFTYFSEFGERSNYIVVFEVTVFIIIFLLSMIANISIVLCVTR